MILQLQLVGDEAAIGCFIHNGTFAVTDSNMSIKFGQTDRVKMHNAVKVYLEETTDASNNGI